MSVSAIFVEKLIDGIFFAQNRHFRPSLWKKWPILPVFFTFWPFLVEKDQGFLPTGPKMTIFGHFLTLAGGGFCPPPGRGGVLAPPWRVPGGGFFDPLLGPPIGGGRRWGHSGSCDKRGLTNQYPSMFYDSVKVGEHSKT